jgi:hypothetical protein
VIAWNHCVYRRLFNPVDDRDTFITIQWCKFKKNWTMGKILGLPSWSTPLNRIFFYLKEIWLHNRSRCQHNFQKNWVYRKTCDNVVLKRTKLHTYYWCYETLILYLSTNLLVFGVTLFNGHVFVIYVQSIISKYVYCTK